MSPESSHRGRSPQCVPAGGDVDPLCGHATVPDREELYPERIHNHYEDPHKRGRCPQCTHAHEDTGPLCGDTVRFELQIDDHGILRDLYFDGDGCCISQAAASMLVEKFDGQHVDGVREFTRQDMLDLLGIPLAPKRQKCGLLAWRVMRAAIDSPVAR